MSPLSFGSAADLVDRSLSIACSALKESSSPSLVVCWVTVMGVISPGTATSSERLKVYFSVKTFKKLVHSMFRFKHCAAQEVFHEKFGLKYLKRNISRPPNAFIRIPPYFVEELALR